MTIRGTNEASMKDNALLASFTKNTRDFYLLFYSTVILTLQSGFLIIRPLVSTLCIFFWGARLKDVVKVLPVIMTIISLSSTGVAHRFSTFSFSEH